jgi:hypothetical protein
LQLRSGAQLMARMDELVGMVKCGLLSAEDVAEEIQLLKAEAKAWLPDVGGRHR